ncbi:MAG: AAA family ATPase [Candidatus Latescibacterota bacterium]
MAAVPLTPLPVVHAAQLEEATPQRCWLVERLWGRAAVGILGGAPKLGKTWLGLDLALSVASATPCLDTFAIHQPGPVLLYLAEDAAPTVKARLRGLCHHRGLDLQALPIWVLAVPTLRLDLDTDQQRLHDTVAGLRPRLLLLDPFVRLHSAAVNENDAGDVSALLAYLRGLQRAFEVAVVVVHHTRKNGRGGGEDPRGSGDFLAWLDSGLHLHRHQDRLVLTVQHRAAAAPAALTLRLHTSDHADDTHLEVLGAPTPSADRSQDLEADVLAVLGQQPLTRAQLRARLRVRNQRLGLTLARLAQQGRIGRQQDQWVIPVPTPIVYGDGNGSDAASLALALGSPA